MEEDYLIPEDEDIPFGALHEECEDTPRHRESRSSQRATKECMQLAHPHMTPIHNTPCIDSALDVEPTITLICTKEYSNVNKIAEHDHLTDENWHEWQERMKQVFINCEITGYTNGTVKCPDTSIDPSSAHNWKRNNTWAQQIIIHNITSSQMNHVGSKTSAEAMYLALSMTHESKAHQTVNHIQCLLYETKVITGADILKHMDILKSHRDRINQFPNAEFHISDT
jgi:hypothetical protein